MTRHVHSEPRRGFRLTGTIQAVLVALAVAVGCLGCSRLDQRRYHLTGVIQEIRSNGEYVVAHEDILGFMPAMTMPFKVSRAPGAIRPGDRIEATLVVTDKESWLEDLRVTFHGLPATAAVSALQPGVAAGDVVQDFGLVNQDGRAIRFADYRGQTLVLTFIYTRCPLPEFCPLMMRNFQKLDEALSETPALFDKTHLLSISFDTAFDTPQVLTSFGSAFVKDRGRGRFAHWELGTGSERQIKDVAAFFGLVYWADAGQLSHSLCTAIIGPDGRVSKLYRDNLWTVEDALAEIRRTTLQRR